MLFSIVTINKPATVLIVVSLEVIEGKVLFFFFLDTFRIVFFVFSTLCCTLIWFLLLNFLSLGFVRLLESFSWFVLSVSRHSHPLTLNVASTSFFILSCDSIYITVQLFASVPSLLCLVLVFFFILFILLQFEYFFVDLSFSLLIKSAFKPIYWVIIYFLVI